MTTAESNLGWPTLEQLAIAAASRGSDLSSIIEHDIDTTEYDAYIESLELAAAYDDRGVPPVDPDAAVDEAGFTTTDVLAREFTLTFKDEVVPVTELTAGFDLITDEAIADSAFSSLIATVNGEGRIVLHFASEITYED